MESQVILHNESNESEYDNIESQVSLHDESMEVDNANVKHMVYCFEWNNKSLLKWPKIQFQAFYKHRNTL